MKKLILIFALIINLIAFSQDDKTVTLVVSGQGKTQDEAKQNALRSAIEQAFGTFISSKTEILNDSLVKDEIVSVANGNIQKFEIISEVQIPNGGYASTLKATVSVTKLTSFVESKGVEVEFKGSLFGANLRQQKLNEEAEYKAILNLCETSNEILSKSLDYSLEVGDPIKDNKSNDYQVLLTVKATPNNNFDQFVNNFHSNIKSISMPISEQEDFKKLNKEIYILKVNYLENYFFRNVKSSIALQNLFLKSNKFIHNFEIITNIDTIKVKTCCYGNDKDREEVQDIYTKRINPYKKAWDLNIYFEIQNIYIDEINPSKIWDLNSGGQSKYNEGFPQFYFVDDYHKFEEFEEASKIIKQEGNARLFHQLSTTSWYNYLVCISNTYPDIFFNSKSYFNESNKFYINESSELFFWLNFRSSPMRGYYCKYPQSEDKYIGNINLQKKNYNNIYRAIYSEEQISKLSNISVKPLK
jgi:hypothetical protein